MVLDSIRSTLDELQQEYSKLLQATVQIYDDLELVAHHIELHHAHQTPSISTPGKSFHEIHEFVADELSQIRHLLERQGEMVSKTLALRRA